MYKKVHLQFYHDNLFLFSCRSTAKVGKSLFIVLYVQNFGGRNNFYKTLNIYGISILRQLPGRVAQSVGHLTRKSGVLSSIPGLATYFRFSFRFFKKGSCQLLAKVCARSTG